MAEFDDWVEGAQAVITQPLDMTGINTNDVPPAVGERVTVLYANATVRRGVYTPTSVAIKHDGTRLRSWVWPIEGIELLVDHEPTDEEIEEVFSA